MMLRTCMTRLLILILVVSLLGGCVEAVVPCWRATTADGSVFEGPGYKVLSSGCVWLRDSRGATIVVTCGNSYVEPCK